MRNLWLVARREYQRTVLRRGFLIGLLAVPVLIGLLVAVVIWVETSNEDRSPVGLVDLGGLLQASAAPATDGPQVLFYASSADARRDLDVGELQAVFILAADYPTTGQMDVFYRRQPPTEAALAAVNAVIRPSLVAGLPEPVANRLLAGAQVTTIDVGSGRAFSEQGIINVIIPVAAAFVLFLVNSSASGSLLQVVTDEKENRTIEVLLTSITSAQLIGGKTAGLLAAVLTEVVVYVAAIVIGLLVARPYVPELHQAVVPWGYLGLVAVFFLPSFALLTAIMVLIGAVVPDGQHGQQFAAFVNLAFMLPVFTLPVIFEDPAQPLVRLLTIFPTTALLTIALRWGLGVVPVLDLIWSWLALAGSTCLMSWAAARVFRLGQLHYGQSLSWKATWAAIRGE
jgi:ABC-2 type transport system permease protein